MEPQRQVPRTSFNPNLSTAHTDVFAKEIFPDSYTQCSRCYQPVVRGLTEGGRKTVFDPATRVDHHLTCPAQ